MPVLKFNQCDYDCHSKKDKRGSFRVYCGKVDKMCSQGSPTPKANGKVGVPSVPVHATEDSWDAVIDIRRGTHIQRIVDAKTLKTIPINRIKGLRVAVWNSIEAEQILDRGGIPVDRDTKKPWIKVGKDVFLGKKPISVAQTATPLTSTEQAVLNILTNTPVHIDEITIASQLPPSKVSSALLILELNDLIKRLPGAYFARK